MAMSKKFNAVTESRKWRIATGKKLSKMSQEKRMEYLNSNIEEKLAALVTKPPVKKNRSHSRKVMAS